MHYSKILRVYILTFFAITHTENSLYCQEITSRSSDQYWFQIYEQCKLSEKWVLLADGGIRMKDHFNHRSATLFRTGIQYKMKSNLSLAVGAAYFSQFSNSNKNHEDWISVEEWRGWQELIFEQQISRVKLSHRFRTEQRYFNDLNSTIDHFNHRARYRLNAIIPLNNKDLITRTIFLNLANEVFLNYGKEIKNNFFDQNRIIGGVGIKLNNSLTFNFNYVYSYAKKNVPTTFLKTNVFWFSVTHQFHLNKKRELSK